MTNILLISEDFIKTNSGLNENIWATELTPAIIVAQDIYLQKFLGTCLYKKILNLVDEGEIELDKNSQYKYLLDEFILTYLLYRTIANLIPEISTKIVNLGVVYSQDEQTTNVSQGERELVITHYSNIADAYCKQMQTFLKEHRADFPELDCDCGIKAELDSSAETTLWLGGLRSRRL